MGFLRKVVKKIGKGIKKVVKKIGKAFGKLGIVGQIGLMFLMPHLGTMWGNIGSWAAKGSNILQKAVGVIHKAGTAVGNAYQTVTQAISNGFDRSLNFMKGEGFVLSDPSKTIFKTPEQKFVEEKGLSIDLEAAEKAGIKLDIEGAETEILPHIIKNRNKIGNVLCEFHANKIDSQKIFFFVTISVVL